MKRSSKALYALGLSATFIFNAACNQAPDERKKSDAVATPSSSSNAQPATSNPTTLPPTTPAAEIKNPLTMAALINYIRLGVTSAKFLLNSKYKESDPAKYTLYNGALDFSQDNIIAFLNGKSAAESSKAMMDYVKAKRADFKIKEEDIATIDATTTKLYADLAIKRDNGELLKQKPTETIAMLIKALPPEVLGDLGDGFDVASLTNMIAALIPQN